MKKFPDESMDMILADPPYNISRENDRRDRSKANSKIMRRNKELNYDFGEWDNMGRREFLNFTNNWLVECCRVLKKNGTIASFFSKEDVNYLGWQAVKYGVRTRTIISWHKKNPVPSFRKVNYLSACEFIWLGSKGIWTFNFSKQSQMHNFYETPNASSYGETTHPTEKPQELISRFIQIHSNPSELILDPFLGSGTTAVVAKQLGRNYIGIELNKDYVEMAKQRLANVTEPMF